MDRFKVLFGIDRKDVKRHCVLSPILAPQMLNYLGVRRLAKGLISSAGQTNDLTFIKTHMGALFVGDVVLQLKDSNCENIIFLGSCGLINCSSRLDIGSVVLPASAYSVESFSDLVIGRELDIHPAYPHDDLLHAFNTIDKAMPNVSCVSFGSMELEDNYRSLFERLGTDVIEMECAALFNAARRINKKALAILFVSDILGEKPFWKNLAPQDKKRLAGGVRQACAVIKFYVENY